MQLLQLEPNKCTDITVFTKVLLHVSAHEVPSSGSQL